MTIINDQIVCDNYLLLELVIKEGLIFFCFHLFLYIIVYLSKK